ncbi:MAG: hypothetical protein K6T57_10790 [Thermaceae bacterium]|nr:hypothetical protein [Thermaceae bacterium]
MARASTLDERQLLEAVWESRSLRKSDWVRLYCLKHPGRSYKAVYRQLNRYLLRSAPSPEPHPIPDRTVYLVHWFVERPRSPRARYVGRARRGGKRGFWVFCAVDTRNLRFVPTGCWIVAASGKPGVYPWKALPPGAPISFLTRPERSWVRPHEVMWTELNWPFTAWSEGIPSKPPQSRSLRHLRQALALYLRAWRAMKYGESVVSPECGADRAS